MLDARDAATLAYDAAKRTARFAAAKGAHDDAVVAARQLQADALEIEAAAKRRLADEYDGAQERGEVAGHGDTLKVGPDVPEQNVGKPTAADLGLTRKEIHADRKLRDAEKKYPGLTEIVLKALLDAGKEPTRAALHRAVDEALEDKSEAEDVVTAAATAALGHKARSSKKAMDPNHRPIHAADRPSRFASLVEELAGFRRAEFEEWLTTDSGSQQSIEKAGKYAASAAAMARRFLEIKLSGTAEVTRPRPPLPHSGAMLRRGASRGAGCSRG